MHGLRIAAALLCLSAGACAGSPAPAGETLVRAPLGGTASAAGVRIRPTLLVEESRCPADAMCVHQGTVRVQAAITAGGHTATHVLTLGRNVRAGPRWVGLAAACPYPLASQPRPPSDYRFVFSVTASDAPPAAGRDLC